MRAAWTAATNGGELPRGWCVWGRTMAEADVDGQRSNGPHRQRGDERAGEDKLMRNGDRTARIKAAWWRPRTTQVKAVNDKSPMTARVKKTTATRAHMRNPGCTDCTDARDGTAMC
jgi:hypothetical protein